MKWTQRRHNDYKKAIRKRRLALEIYDGYGWYKNLHQYSKNKIHCSCNLCKFRPNYDPDNKPMQDIRRLQDMEQQMQEYKYVDQAS